VGVGAHVRVCVKAGKDGSAVEVAVRPADCSAHSPPQPNFHPPAPTKQVATYALIWPARRLADVEVVGVAARDPVRAQRYAAAHGLPRAYGCYEALVEDPTLDAVYVGLPNGLHGRWTAAALQAGKHVLCEKPFAANQEEAR